MRRIIFDVPRWHAYLHRDARCLEIAKDNDDPVRKFEDELFDQLYSGELTSLTERQQDPKLRTWAEGVHRTCEELPAFGRLAAECLGDAMAAATAVETLMAVLNPQVPDQPEAKPPENLRRSLAPACEKASAAVEDLRDSLEGLGITGGTGVPGTSSASGGTLPAKAIRELASKLRADPRLRQISKLAGRMKRIAASKRRSRVKHGADEITDIEQGADLGRLLPSELLKLTHPKLRLAFMRSFLERAALQYQLVGNEPLGRGPLVVLLDKSGSMDGPRDTWATALTLALLDQAHRERRTFTLLAFDYHVKFEAIVKPCEALPEQALFTACAGGTEISMALQRGLEIIKNNEGQLKKADIVLITDGGSDAASAPRLRAEAQQLGTAILGLGIGVERNWLQPWCDDVQAITDISRLDDETASKLFAA